MKKQLNDYVIVKVIKDKEDPSESGFEIESLDLKFDMVEIVSSASEGINVGDTGAIVKRRAEPIFIKGELFHVVHRSDFIYLD